MVKALAYTTSRVSTGTAPRVLARIRGREPLIAGLLVALTLTCVWLLTGVAIGEALRFTAFEALYVLLPGCMLYVLLSHLPPRPLRVLAIGWPLGYALEMGAYALTAGLGARGAFSLLPLAALVVLGPLVYVRRRPASLCLPKLRVRAPRSGLELLSKLRMRASSGGPELLLLGVAVSLALILLSLKYFSLYPLPWHTSSIVYAEDNVAQISYAVVARYHWPVTIPFAAGEPWRYYIGVFMHYAAINQVFGVNFATISMRFFPATAILIFALQLWFLGGTMGRSRWIGPLAVVLFFIVEDVNLDPTRRLAFGSDLFGSIALSPTSTFALIFFLGQLALMQTAVLEGEGSRGGAGAVAMLGILAAGGTAAAIYAPIDFLGGLGLYWLWRTVTRGFDRLLSACLVVSTLGLLVIQQLLLSGSDLGATRGYRLFAFLINTNFSILLSKHGLIWAIPSLFAAIVVVLCAWSAIYGAAFLWWIPKARSANIGLPLAILLVAFTFYLLVTFLKNQSLTYVFWYGFIGTMPVAALGFVSAWSHLSAAARRQFALACGVILCAGLVLCASSGVLIAAHVLAPAKHRAWDAWYALAYGALACLILLVARILQPHLRRLIPSSSARVLACCIPLLCVLGLVKPIAWTAHRAGQAVLARHVGLVDSRAHAGLTTALYEGLLWVRSHTNSCNVLARSTLYTPAGEPVDEYAYFSAFTERLVYLEAWVGTARAEYDEITFPGRFALNRQATVEGKAAALQQLAQLGVSYVLLDKLHGGRDSLPASAAQRVFENSALGVYRLLDFKQAGRKCAAIA
jgi:hypothetical protein